MAGDKNGRKFLGYVIGIALFIVLLPLIAVYGLFGWMSGSTADIVNYDRLYSQLPTEQRELMEQHEEQLEQITLVFANNGLSEKDISKAKTIYVSCLIGKEIEAGFYQTYADCFLHAKENGDLLTHISSAFGVTFSDAQRKQFENLYS